jgi:DNA-binding LacI/PurR family transcriptional regulator
MQKTLRYSQLQFTISHDILVTGARQYGAHKISRLYCVTQNTLGGQMPRKQDSISDILREEIRSGKYAVGTRIPPQSELSERFGASEITVNKALNTLVEQGYLHRPGGTRAGTLVKSIRPYPQGFIAIEVSFGFGAALIEGALMAAEKSNYMLVPVRHRNGEMGDVVKRIKEGRFQGLLSGSHELIDFGVPTVYMDSYHHKKHPEVYEVSCDIEKAVEKLSDAVWTAGHRDIAYCTFWHDSAFLHPRLDAFLQAMRNHGLNDVDQRIYYGQNEQPSCARNLLRHVLSERPGVSAICCWNDWDAMLIRRAGRELGIDIGRKICLTGCGSLAGIQTSEPFPTIEQFPTETGFRACMKLISLIERPNAQHSHVELLDAELRNVDLISPPAIS